MGTAVKKGTHTTQKTKIWNKVAFRLPNTQVQKRNSKVLLRSVRAHNTFDRFAVIKNPLSSESAIKTIEDNNTLVFIVHKKASKKLIKEAYVALSSDQDALDIANKIGIM